MLIKPSFPRMIRVCKEAGNSQRSGKSFVKAELFAIIEGESLNKFWGNSAESLMGSEIEFGGGAFFHHLGHKKFRSLVHVGDDSAKMIGSNNGISFPVTPLSLFIGNRRTVFNANPIRDNAPFSLGL